MHSSDRLASAHLLWQIVADSTFQASWNKIPALVHAHREACRLGALLVPPPLWIAQLWGNNDAPEAPYLEAQSQEAQSQELRVKWQEIGGMNLKLMTRFAKARVGFKAMTKSVWVLNLLTEPLLTFMPRTASSKPGIMVWLPSLNRRKSLSSPVKALPLGCMQQSNAGTRAQWCQGPVVVSERPCIQATTSILTMTDQKVYINEEQFQVQIVCCAFH